MFCCCWFDQNKSVIQLLNLASFRILCIAVIVIEYKIWTLWDDGYNMYLHTDDTDENMRKKNRINDRAVDRDDPVMCHKDNKFDQVGRLEQLGYI